MASVVPVADGVSVPDAPDVPLGLGDDFPALVFVAVAVAVLDDDLLLSLPPANSTQYPPIPAAASATTAIPAMRIQPRSPPARGDGPPPPSRELPHPLQNWAPRDVGTPHPGQNPPTEGCGTVCGANVCGAGAPPAKLVVGGGGGGGSIETRVMALAAEGGLTGGGGSIDTRVIALAAEGGVTGGGGGGACERSRILVWADAAPVMGGPSCAALPIAESACPEDAEGPDAPSGGTVAAVEAPPLMASAPTTVAPAPAAAATTAAPQRVQNRAASDRTSSHFGQFTSHLPGAKLRSP